MPGVGGLGDQRRWVWLRSFGALLIAGSLVYAVVELLSADSRLDPPALLGLPVGVASLVVSAMALRRPPESTPDAVVEEWVENLARQVEESESRQWRQLLGGDRKQINLTFTLYSEHDRTAIPPSDRGQLLADMSALPDVATYYLNTRPRRLLITGAPGAGKTVLALALMLELNKGRTPDDPVPVRLSMAEWDTSLPLPQQLIRQLVEVYEWPRHIAAELVGRHRVLPFLDGLDEMDPAADGIRLPFAPRAQAAVEALNAYQNGTEAGPVVLTCRTAVYRALTERTQLLDAVHIDIDKVTAPAARTYLLERTSNRVRWQPVTDRLRDDPTGTLAATLSTPWRLCLAATVYARDGDPAELLDHATPHDLDEHLLARFIPAATRLHPRRPYSAVTVHGWLARFAAHLATPAADSAAATRLGTDLVLHHLWPMAGPRRIRVVEALVTGLCILLLVGLLGSQSSLWYPPIVIIAAVVAGAFAARAPLAPPVRVHWRGLRSLTTRRSLLRILIVGVTVALTVGVTENLFDGFGNGHTSAVAFGFTDGLAGGLAIGLGFGLATGLADEPPVAVKPREIIRYDLAFIPSFGIAVALGFGVVDGLERLIVDVPGGGFAYGLVGGLRFGLTAALAYGLAGGLSGGLTAALAVELTWGSENTAIMLTYGLTIAVVFATAGGLSGGIRPGLRYLVFIACTRRKLPLRLSGFMDWACEAGMLRLAGSAYQFRHRELQQWLNNHPTPPSG